MSAPLVLGPDDPTVTELAEALGATVEVLPGLAPDPHDTVWRWARPLEDWRTEVAGREPVAAIVVLVPSGGTEPSALVEVDLDTWTERAEAVLAAWVAALGAAKARCADDGAVVAVVDRPPPLDSAGRAIESGVADAVEAMVRSLARSEGHRAVRVNAVSSPARVGTDHLVDPAPPLSSFPGTAAREVAGAVRLLLAPDAIGITGTVVHADCGRSWR